MSEGGPNPTLALAFEGVGFAYPDREDGSDEVLHGVTLHAHAGERLGILGPNGGGKSTLLKLAVGLLTPTAGTVRVFGRTPTDARRAGLIGYLEQRCEAGFDWPVTVRQVVTMPVAARVPPWKRVPQAERDRVDRVLGLVGLAGLEERRIGALSGGQRQRALIARAVACAPKLLMLDEPTVGVDVAGQRRFAQMLDALRAELGLTVVVVSHDLAAIAATSDRVGCLRRTLHYHSAPEGLTPAVLAEVFSHDVEAAFGAVHIDAHAASECGGLGHHAPDHAHATDQDHRGCAHDGTRPADGRGEA